MSATLGPNGLQSVDRGEAPNIAVQYDASAKSYAIQSGDAALATLQSQSTLVSSNPIVDVFRAAAGLVVNTLQLTRTGASGRYQTRYVAGGLLQQQQTLNGLDQRDTTSFVFGLRTPDAEIPRTGAADFAVGLLGNTTFGANLTPLTGGGVLRLDFATGRLSGGGVGSARPSFSPTSPDLASPFYFNWIVDAQLAAASNRIQGGINLNLGTGFTSSGTLDGRLFGPGGGELGASFSAGSGMLATVGTLTGPRGGTAPAPEGLASLLGDTAVPYLRTSVRYLAGSSPNAVGEARLGGGSEASVMILPGEQAVELPFLRLDPASRLDSLTDERFVGYRVTDPLGFPVRAARLYRIAANPELALSYSTFALVDFTGTGGDRIDESYFFGIETGFVNVPRTGRGTYEGILLGTAVGAGAQADRFNLTGGARLEFDWSALSMSGTLTPTAVNQRTSQSFALGEFNLTSVLPRFGSSRFRASISGPPGAIGNLTGGLYGPTGEEAGGTFELVTPGAGTVLAAQGVVATTRRSTGPSSGSPPPVVTPGVPLIEPWPIPINPRLDQLTQSEEFLAHSSSATAVYPFQGTSPIFPIDRQLTVKFDGATGNYTVSVPTSAELPAATASFAPSSRDAAASDAVANVFRTGTASNGDTLRLTVAGSAGRFGTRYVAGGLWQNTRTTGGIELNRLEGFTYGIRTPGVQVPRTTALTYGMGFELLHATPEGLRPIAGTGQLTIDWAAQRITGRGTTFIRGPLDNGVPSLQLGSFEIGGSAGSGANVIFGSLQSSDNIFGGFGAFFNGYFYGPAANEFGLSLDSNTGGDAPRRGAGYGVGVLGAPAPEIETLAALRGPASIDRWGNGIDYREIAQQPGTFGQGVFLTDFGRVRLLPATGTLDFAGAQMPGHAAAIVTDADRVAAESNARFTTYRVTAPGGTTTWRRYNGGSGNDQLALSYASFALLDFAGSDGTRGERAFLFGLATPAQGLPRTGTGVFQSVVYGAAVGTGATGQDRFTLGGTAQVNVDWAASAFTASFDINATNLRTSLSASLPATMASGSADRSGLFGSLSGGATGFFSGRFFGPDARELGATFGVSTSATPSLPALTGHAVLVGTRQ